MPLRPGTLVRLALALALSVGAPACKDDRPPPDPTGSWRSEDGLLLLRIFPNDAVQWYFAAGGGSCVFLAQGTLDAEDGVLVSEYDDEYPYTLGGDVLEVDDPADLLDGSFVRVEQSAVCYTDVPPLTVQSDRVTTMPLGAAIPVQGGVGRAVELEVPADAVSFGFYLFGDTVGSRAAFGALVAPDGTNVLDEANEPPGAAESDLQFCMSGFCSLVVPKETNVLPAAGTWTAVVVANGVDDIAAVSVRSIVREGPLGPTTFSVRPFRTTTVITTTELGAVLDEVAALFDSMYGVTLTVEPIVTITTPGADALVQDVLHPDTAEVMAAGHPDSINLFFAERLLGVGGLLGIASGIPASHGVAGPFDGLLVHVANHLDADGNLVPGLLEETVAHEMGHMLGLFHPTESNAAFFDPIADTPECSLEEHDLDMDGTVYADECVDAGGDNLMFWTPTTTTGEALVQRALSDDQLFVLERSLGGQ